MDDSVFCGRRLNPFPPFFRTNAQIIKEPTNQPRLIFPKYLSYCNKVKTGNWFEDQQEPRQENYRHHTEYCHEYVCKPLTTVPRSVKWDIVLKTEGDIVICPPRTTDCLPNFHDNYSTSYDLSYRHLPKISPSPDEHAVPSVRKVGKPRQVSELIESYGNVTNYGLSDSKKEEIKCNNPRRRATAKTVNQSDFISPEENAYNFRRWPRFKAIPTRTADIYPPLPPDHPRVSECNILNWECRDKDKVLAQPNYQLDCS